MIFGKRQWFLNGMCFFGIYYYLILVLNSFAPSIFEIFIKDTTLSMISTFMIFAMYFYDTKKSPVSGNLEDLKINQDDKIFMKKHAWIVNPPTTIGFLVSAKLLTPVYGISLFEDMSLIQNYLHASLIMVLLAALIFFSSSLPTIRSEKKKLEELS